MEDFTNLPSHAKWIKRLKDDANYMVKFLQDGNCRMVKHYVDEMEWLLGKVKEEAYDAAARYEKDHPRKAKAVLPSTDTP